MAYSNNFLFPTYDISLGSDVGSLQISWRERGGDGLIDDEVSAFADAVALATGGTVLGITRYDVGGTSI